MLRYLIVLTMVHLAAAAIVGAIVLFGSALLP